MAETPPPRTADPYDGSPGVLRMAAPLVVSFWMRALFTFVDAYYASLLGDSAVAAIGLSIPFEFLMIAVWVGLSTGLTSNLSRAMGAREGAKIDQHLRTAWKLVWSVVPLFAAIGAGCWIFSSSISPGPEVARQFGVYGLVLIGGSAFSMFWSVIPDSVVKAHNDTRSTMWAGILSNVINVVLNTIFMFVFHWGILGIGLSTVIGRFGGLAYALRKAAGHESARKARASDVVPGLDPHPWASIFTLAVPAAVSYCLMAAEGFIVNRLLRDVDHATEAIAAYAIYYRVFQFVIMPAIATAVAMLPYTARRYGKRDFAGIRRGLRQAHVANALYLLAAAPVLFFGAGPISAAFTNSALTRGFATFALRLIPLACFASMSIFLCRPAFEGLGRGRPGLVIALLRYLVLTAPASWAGIRVAAALGLPGLHGLLVGLIAATALSSVLFLYWIRTVLRAEEPGPRSSPILASAEP